MNSSFFIFHWTNIKNLISVLKEGTLYGNSFLKDSRKRCSGKEDSIFIYTSIYFDKLPDKNRSTGLILDKKVMKEQCCIFNHGWLAQPRKDSIYICPHDKLINKKITDIITYRKQKPFFMDHELLFIGRLNIKPYLKSVVLVGATDKETEKIKKLLKDKYQIDYLPE